MTRRTDAQTMLTELVLFGMFIPDPKQLLDPELQRLDEVLDDEPLVDAVVEKLRARHPRSRRRGRPSTPADVVLRMLVLKHLRHWSYDRLQWEVTGNVAYRKFCRIGGGKVPDAKTLVRLGQLLPVVCRWRPGAAATVATTAASGRRVAVEAARCEP